MALAAGIAVACAVHIVPVASAAQAVPAARAAGRALSLPAMRQRVPVAHAAPVVPIAVDVGSVARGRPLAPGFLGLALEYRSIPSLAGARSASAVDPVLVALVHALDPAGGTVLRIGGQSADRSWWPVPGMPRPPGITYDLTPAWVASAAALAQALNAKLILGLGLEADRPRIDAVEAGHLLAGLGGMTEALTIGNEPMLYSQIPWYRILHGKAIPWYSQGGTAVYGRAPTYGPAAYEREWSRVAAALPKGVPLAGPDDGTPSLLQGFERRLGPRSRLRLIAVHDYPLSRCDGNPASSGYPSVPNLLTPAAASGAVRGLGPGIALAHRYGAKFLIDEMGSISCNGRAGVSDTLASALWLLDALFRVDAAGIDGVQLHNFSGLVNDLFDFTHAGGDWLASVHPLYYGALMFTQAAPAGSRLLRATSADPVTLRSWATTAPDGRVRVLLINDSLSSTALALVRVAGRAGGASSSAAAALERLRAASAYSTGGVSLGGRSFGSLTATGSLPAPVPESAEPRAGAYRIRLAPGSAALLTLPPVRTAPATAR